MPVVFITGATSGFGAACAQKYASNGYNLILNGRREDRLAALADECSSKFGVRTLQLPFDVSNQASVFNAIASLDKEWQRIDILVNNAGLALGRDYFEEANLDDWNTMVDTNIKGAMYVARAVTPLMAARFASEGISGHVVNMGSVAGKDIYERGNIYCATKAAVDAMSHAMRIDLLRHQIRVTAIHPGAAETEFALVRFKGDAATAKSVYKGIQPLTADDVADVVFYCTSLPPHVCINDLVLTCTQQADGIYFNRDTA